MYMDFYTYVPYIYPHTQEMPLNLTKKEMNAADWARGARLSGGENFG